MKKIKTEDLRAQLDTLSPEQQWDKDKAVIEQSLEKLSVLDRSIDNNMLRLIQMTDQVKSAANKIEKLIPSLQVAATIHMDEWTKQNLETTVLNMGESAAAVVNAKIHKVLGEVKAESNRISVPANFAIIFMIMMAFSIMLLLVIIVTNIMYIHSGKLWVVLGIGIGTEIFTLALTWYLHRKGWI